MSCAICHVPEQGPTNNELARPIGTEGRSLRRNAPGLFNVAHAERLFHDGSPGSLEEVVRFYDRGGHRHPGLDPLIRPLGLSDREVAALVAFLESLTGDNLAELIADARSVAVGN